MVMVHDTLHYRQFCGEQMMRVDQFDDFDGRVYSQRARRAAAVKRQPLAAAKTSGYYLGHQVILMQPMPGHAMHMGLVDCHSAAVPKFCYLWMLHCATFIYLQKVPVTLLLPIPSRAVLDVGMLGEASATAW